MKPLNARFQKYYNENYQMVYRTALSIVKNRTAADDVTSEVFICLYKYLSRQDLPIERIRSWLYVTAKYRAYNHLRDNDRLIPTERIPEAGDSSGADPDSRLFASELLDALYRKSPKWFDVVEKYYFLELSAQEIALEYGCTPHAVLALLARARKYLREKFGEDFHG